MALYIYPPYFDLASMDTECLKFLAAARFCAADIRLVYCDKPLSSPSGRLPCFQEDGRLIDDFEQFVDHLRNQHSDIQLDAELDLEQKVMLKAYNALLRTRLVPALEQLFFLDDYNYSASTSGMFSTIMSFPFGLYYANQRRAAAERLVRSTSQTPEELQMDALKTLNLLSAKLGEHKYFNGNKPGSMDALIFGHLAPLLKVPLANDRLQLQLRALPNLCIFLESISSIYMPLSEEQLRESAHYRSKLLGEVERSKRAFEKLKLEQQMKRAEDKKSKDKSSADSWNVAFFAAVSVTASILFAIHTGILRVPTVIADEEEEVEIAA